MSSVVQLRSFVLGYEQDLDIIRDQLQAASVPITAADCHTSCEESGPIKPYRRQVVIPTEWGKYVTKGVKGSLAVYLRDSGIGSWLRESRATFRLSDYPAATMFSLRRLQSVVLGYEQDPDIIRDQLQAASVPVTAADCRTCSNPCEEGHDSYPDRFDVDRTSQMLGSVHPYRRQVVISTGKSDWDKQVTETKGSLAAYLLGAQNHASLPISEPVPPKSIPSNGTSTRPAAGIFRSSDSTRISILNGSHHTMSDDLDLETVLVFPDYTIVADIPRSREGAQALWESTVDPDVGRGGAGTLFQKSSLKTWVLPYSCVILLCSHKKRDNRCAIAAPKLENAFVHSLQENGWAADTHLECQCLMGLPLEELQGTPEETEQHIAKELQSSAKEKRALILKTSHIGGHKYAGNCIIYTPQGSSIWYGRVSPHEVESIVVNTIINGLVLPPLLRGGLNISRPGCKTLNDW